ncbi:unnamed protein product, partial [Strongylus vulgaris]
TEDRVPDRPENVRVRTTATTATLWWDAPSDKSTLVRGYTISYGVATPSRRIVIEGANTNSFTLNRLEPDTDYVFAVGAYNEADGEDGEPVLLSARTLPSDGTPAFSLWPPIAVRAHSPRPGEVLVTWEDPNPEQDIENEIDGTQRHYLIQYGIYQSEQLSKMRSNSRSVKLTGLLPSKEYEIAVKVVGEDGRESPWSIRDIVLTPPGSTTVAGGTVTFPWFCILSSPKFISQKYALYLNLNFVSVQIPTMKFHDMTGNAILRRICAECVMETGWIGLELAEILQLIMVGIQNFCIQARAAAILGLIVKSNFP